MRKMRIVSVALLAILLVPALASATHFNGEVTFRADCEQWSSEVPIIIRTGLPDAQLQITITFTEVSASDPVLTLYTEVTVPTDADRMVVAQLGDLWNNMTEEIVHLLGTYEVHAVIRLYAPWSGGIDDETREFSIIMNCDVVGDEDISWGTIKGLYR